MGNGQNSREDELKRKRRSLLGKIDRRETVILFARSHIRDYRRELGIIEVELAEYKPVKPRPDLPNTAQQDEEGK